MSRLICSGCGAELTSDNACPFELKRKNTGRCRVCINARQRRGRRSNYRLHMYDRAKQGAGNRGLLFTIQLSDIPWLPRYCPVLGIALEIATGRANHNSPSLDRIDNSRGYEPGNIRIISHRANQLKSDATSEELIQLGRDAKRIRRATGNQQIMLKTRHAITYAEQEAIIADAVRIERPLGRPKQTSL